MPVRTRSQTRARRLAAAVPVVATAVPVVTAVPVAVSGISTDTAPPPAKYDEPTVCAICLESICWPHRLACGHAFHATCLQKWGTLQDAMRRPGSCPMCRAPLHPPPWRTLLQQGGAAWLAWRCFSCA